ncbi:alpha/beta fold hydrolase [Rhodococcus sp. NPDC127528]|uniref:alpha/beta fold hydrolase n=1 Tax=unclassified Rhodococcus (in: high G+C Gram-positive bacteria) TaxID=192944 RepID=UPI0036380689
MTISSVNIPTTLGRLSVGRVGTGPPAVLWHSLFVDSQSWHAVVDSLAAQRTLILVDGPCHGGSGAAPARFDLDACADAAAGVLDDLGIADPVDWVGNAWGGHVGLRFAALHPARCRSLAAIGTPVHALTPTERWARVVPLVTLYRLAGPVPPVTRALAKALLGAECPAEHPDSSASVMDAFRRADRTAMLQAMHSVMLDRPDLTDTLPGIGVPTVMLAATGDSMWSPAQAEAAAAVMPSARSLPVRGGGHIAPLLVDPESVVASVTALWRDPRAYVSGR